MPWKVVKRTGAKPWKIVNKTTGKTVGSNRQRVPGAKAPARTYAGLDEAHGVYDASAVVPGSYETVLANTGKPGLYSGDHRSMVYSNALKRLGAQSGNGVPESFRVP